MLQEKGTYYKEDSKLGDYLNFEDFALRMIANGRVKFVWKSDPNNSAIKGLGAHLGFEDNENERKRVFSILANADKGGLRPDEVAQELAEIYNSSNANESIDTMKALDTILDIIRSYGGKTRDMMNAAIAAHADVGMDEKGYMEDRQGNPINPDGTLYAESVSSIDEITDEDFTEPTRNIALPKIPENVDNAIGANGKPIIIKKNIFKRNSQVHPEVSPQQAREILSSALYRPDLYGQNQKTSRPYNWIVISTKDSAGQNRLVVLEVNENKDNVEIIHWYNARNSSIEQIKRQAQKEGGLILILPSETEEAGGLSSRQSGLSSEGKDTNIFEESNIETEKPVAEQITEQRKVVNTEPTEAQKEAGNYRMGHVKIDGMDVTIENPKGSIRRGTDADGKKWESEMHYDYGYIRGTKAVDNDHIDIFLSDNPSEGNVGNSMSTRSCTASQMRNLPVLPISPTTRTAGRVLEPSPEYRRMSSRNGLTAPTARRSLSPSISPSNPWRLHLDRSRSTWKALWAHCQQPGRPSYQTTPKMPSNPLQRKTQNVRRQGRNSLRQRNACMRR